MKQKLRDKVWKAVDSANRDGSEYRTTPDVPDHTWWVVADNISYNCKKGGVDLSPLFFVTELAFGNPHAFLQNAQDDRKSKIKASPFNGTEYFAF